jgi:acyl dehydratase
MADERPADERPWGVITDEGIERLRARVGVAEPWTNPPHYYAPNVDAFRHVANCYGDDNPLYCDPVYAEKSVWGGIIAPPPMVGGDTLIGEDEVTRVAEDKRDLMKGDPLRGVHAFYSASAREWWAPLRPDHRVFRRNAMVAVLDKQSEFAKRAVHEWSANVFRTEENTILCGQYRLMIRTEREKARERGKYDEIEFHPYTDDEIDAIESAYDRQIAERRGAEPRFFEDVSEGDELTPMVKGPLRVTDMVVWHTGMGMGLYGVKALDLGRGMRQRIPSFIHRDELNVPDVMQRVHWDPEVAKKAGNPTTFDYGRMRETGLIHFCTNWMGDDAWLWKLDCEFRGFNYNGDTQWLHGTVVRKYVADGGRPAVDLDIRCENQRGVITAPGHATILLPSREHGSVRLPDVPGHATDLEGALSAISAEFSRK